MPHALTPRQAGRDWLPVLEGEVETPLGRAAVEFVDPSQPVLVVPILRAGLVLLEQAATLLPAHVTFHFGVSRDERTLTPSVYLDKLPPTISPDARVLITDPMIATGAPRVRRPASPDADSCATGGSLCLCLDAVLQRGATLGNIRVVGAVAAPPALKRLSEEYPGARVTRLSTAHLLRKPPPKHRPARLREHDRRGVGRSGANRAGPGRRRRPRIWQRVSHELLRKVLERLVIAKQPGHEAAEGAAEGAAAAALA